VEGTAPRNDDPAALRPNRNGFHIRLSRPGGNRIVAVDVGPDGHFILPRVVPGEWQFSVTPLPPGFLKSARFGDKDVRFTTFQIGSSGDIPLNIVISMHTATVKGEIDTGLSGSARAGIVIAPVGPYHDLARFYYGGMTGAKGKFHVGGIAPGKYKIFAIEKMAAANFRNPEAVDQLGDLGEVIDLAEGATFEAHPKLITADRAAQALQ
jgi:hypothetical protein